MNWLMTALRRSLWLVLIGAVGGLGWSWWRDRNAPPAPDAPPEWPPITSTEPTTAEPEAPNAPEAPTNLATISSVPNVSDVTDVTDDSNWVDPTPDGGCPPSHPIKANDNSGIYHVPGGRFYARTKAERCYATAAAAEGDGYRPAKA